MLSACNKKLQSQQGTTLIEALVVMLLVAVISMGAVRVLGVSAVAQKETNGMGLALGQLRSAFQTGQCSASTYTDLTLSMGSKTLAASCQSNPQSITVSSATLLSGGGVAIDVSVAVPDGQTDSQESVSFFGGSLVVESM